MQALASSFSGVRLTPAQRAPAAASRRGLVCVADLNRLPPATLKKVTFDGAPAGEATIALKSAPEDTAKGLVHRYLVMVRQNARRPRDWTIKMNKKEKRLAMATALQSAATSMTVVEDITTAQVPGYKTKVFADAMKKWGVNELDDVLLITKEVVETVAGSSRNIGNLVVSPVGALNVYDVLRADKLFVEASALEHLNTWFGAEGAAWE